MWTHDGLVYWCMYALLSPNELKQDGVMSRQKWHLSEMDLGNIMSAVTER